MTYLRKMDWGNTLQHPLKTSSREFYTNFSKSKMTQIFKESIEIKSICTHMQWRVITCVYKLKLSGIVLILLIIKKLLSTSTEHFFKPFKQFSLLKYKLNGRRILKCSNQKFSSLLYFKEFNKKYNVYTFVMTNHYKYVFVWFNLHKTWFV